MLHFLLYLFLFVAVILFICVLISTIIVYGWPRWNVSVELREALDKSDHLNPFDSKIISLHYCSPEFIGMTPFFCRYLHSSRQWYPFGSVAYTAIAKRHKELSK